MNARLSAWRSTSASRLPAAMKIKPYGPRFLDRSVERTPPEARSYTRSRPLTTDQGRTPGGARGALTRRRPDSAADAGGVDFEAGPHRRRKADALDVGALRAGRFCSSERFDQGPDVRGNSFVGE